MAQQSNKTKRTELGTLGEFGIINHLTKNYAPSHLSTIKGIGDDAAILENGDLLTVVSTDMLVEGIHFDLTYTPLKHLGYKAVIVNLSDIYAMNAFPKQITVSLAISNRFSVEALEELYAGIYLACEEYNVDLVGGDTTSSRSGLYISITAIGQVEKDKVTYRNTAKVGDLICVTGNLGAAYLGLQLLEREKQIFLEHPDMKPELEEQEYVISRQLKPEARKDMIAMFRKTGLVPTSMIDVSDGLASELFHIGTQSKVGVIIEEPQIPVHNDAQELALKFNLDPTTCALSGGEDYELLFTVDPKDLEKARYLPDTYIIGEIVEASEGFTLHTGSGNIHHLKAQGWQHFNK